MTSLAASVTWSEAGTVSSQNDFRPPTGFTLDPETEFQERWSIIEKRIRSFADLRDDWDGLDSEAPELDVIVSAQELVAFLKSDMDSPTPSRVVPTPGGGVLFEWQLSGEYIEAEISEARRVDWMVQQSNNRPSHFTWSWDEPGLFGQGIRPVLQEFVAA